MSLFTPWSRALSLAGVMTFAASIPALAQGTPEERDACAPDAIRLCSDTIPDVDRTSACMKAHESELSPRCQAFVDPPPVVTPDIRAEQETSPRPDDGDEIAPPRRRHHVIPPDDDSADVGPAADSDDNRDLRHARAVLGRLCNQKVIDASTCAFTDQMMNLAR